MSARAQAAAATGERVLAAAWRQFGSRPYDDVPLREIAAQAGVTVQTLHARFGGKEDLFTAAYAWFGREELERRPAAPSEDVAGAVSVLYERYERHGGAVLRMLSQEQRIAAVRRMTEAGRLYHRHWVQTTFAPLLAGLRGSRRARCLNAIVLATDVLAWKLLREDMGLAREEAERTVVTMVEGAAMAQRRRAAADGPGAAASGRAPAADPGGMGSGRAPAAGPSPRARRRPAPPS